MVKKKLEDITAEEVDQMMLLRFGQHVDSNAQPAFLSYSQIGNLYKMSATSARTLILRRISERARQHLGSSLAQDAENEERPKAKLKRFRFRFLRPEQLAWICSAETL